MEYKHVMDFLPHIYLLLSWDYVCLDVCYNVVSLRCLSQLHGLQHFGFNFM